MCNTMSKRIGEFTGDENVQIIFVYQKGNPNKLEQKHIQAFENVDHFNINFHFIEWGVDNITVNETVSFHPTTLEEALGRPESLIWGETGGTWDLRDAPLISYDIGPWHLYGEDGMRTDTIDKGSLNELIRILETGYYATNQHLLAVYGQPPDQRHFEDMARHPPFTAKSLAHDEYEALSWLTLFTPSMVETYGREKLLSAPAHRIEELDDGAVLIVCHKKPLDPDTNCREVADHIGLPLLQDLA
jgi:hypothetical protein